MSRSSQRKRQLERDHKFGRESKVERTAVRLPAEKTIARAARLIQDGDLDAARALLETQLRSEPGRSDALQLLLEIYQELGDNQAFCQTAEQLRQKFPSDRHLQLMFASGCLKVHRPIEALHVFRQFVKRWGNDPLAAGAREMLADLEVPVAKMLTASPFDERDRFELGLLHEQALWALQSGDHPRVIRVGEELRRRAPDFVSNLNNLSESYFQSERIDDACLTLKEVLDLDQDNFHALSNLGRFLLLTGRISDAESLRDRLRHVNSTSLEYFVKVVELLSHFGDDQAVSEVFEQARALGHTASSNPNTAQLLHLAGVSLARQGQTARAKECWRAALKIDPSNLTITDNLKDLEKPAEKRQGAWPFPINGWMNHKTSRRACEILDASGKNTADELQRFLANHPWLTELVPKMLERGDQITREIACRIADGLGTPELTQALLDFCLSKNGPDELRMKTLFSLNTRKLLTETIYRFWSKGQWIDIELNAYEITHEPLEKSYSPHVENLIRGAMAAMYRGDGCAAEASYNKAIAEVGETPDLLHNLSNAYQVQGRSADARALALQVHQRWPDYFFGNVSAARACVESKDFDQAKQILDSLRRQTKLHITQYVGLCIGHIELLIAEGNQAAAKSWLAQFRQADPHHPGIAALEEQLGERATTLKRLGKLF